jgi:outer membrane protein TolC
MLCLFVLLGWIGSLTAQNQADTVHYTLKMLLAAARENNRDLKLLQLDIHKSYQEIGLRKSGYLPRIYAFADYFYYPGNLPQYIFPEKEGTILSGGTSEGIYPVPLGLPNNLLAGVSLSQRLFEFSFLSAGKTGELAGEIESGRIREKKEQLYFDVTLCYYELLQLASKRNYVKFNLTMVGKFLDIIQIQLRNQMTDSLQLLDAALAKSELALRQNELESGIRRKTNYLKMLAGLPDTVFVTVEPSDYSASADSFPPDSQPGANAQLGLLTNAQNMNQISQKQVQSDYLPRLDLKLNLLWMGQSQKLDFSSGTLYGNTVSTIGMKLDIPIYQGSEKKHKIQKLEIDRQILELQKQKLEEGYQLQANNFREELRLKRERYLYQKEITRLKTKSLEKENRRFEQGVLPIRELLAAQSALLENQMRESEALFDMKIAELNYVKWSNRLLPMYDN